MLAHWERISGVGAKIFGLMWNPIGGPVTELPEALPPGPVRDLWVSIQDHEEAARDFAAALMAEEPAGGLYNPNVDSVAALNNVSAGVTEAILDGRHRPGASHHAKMLVIRNADGLVAWVAGIDVNTNRVNTTAHFDYEPGAMPYHDVQVRIEGPAARDVLRTFLSRWNDHPAMGFDPDGPFHPVPDDFNGKTGDLFSTALGFPNATHQLLLEDSDDRGGARTWCRSAEPLETAAAWRARRSATVVSSSTTTATRLATEMITSARWVAQSTRELDTAVAHHDFILDELALLLQAGARVHSSPVERELAQEDTEEQVPGSDEPSDTGEALLRVLKGHPRHGNPLDVDPSALLSELSDGVGGWRNLNRALVVAAFDWSEVVGPVPVAVRRGVLADVAALTDAVALLQRDLAENLDLHRHRMGLAQQLRTWSMSFESAANAVLRETINTSTKDWWTPPSVTNPRILPVLRAQQIPEAALSLARMLHDPHLRLDAETAIEVIVVHAMMSAVAADYLHSAGRTETLTLLKRHSEKLIGIAGEANKRAWSRMKRAHDHPLRQARELHWAIGRAFRPGKPEPELRKIATEYATIAPAIVAGLKIQVQAAARRCDWAYLDGLRWQAAGAGQLRRLVYGLERGHEVISHFGPGVVRTDTSRSSDPRAAHCVLADAKARLRRPEAEPRPPPPPALNPHPSRPR